MLFFYGGRVAPDSGFFLRPVGPGQAKFPRMIFILVEGRLTFEGLEVVVFLAG